MLGRQRSALAMAFLALVVCLSPGAAVRAQPSDGPVAAEAAIRTASLPGRNDADLASRFGRDLLPSSTPSPPPFTDTTTIGQAGRFWVMRSGQPGYREAVAHLRHISEHAYWYVEEGQQVDQHMLERVATAFDQRVYPLVRRAFGTEPLPGIDGDARLTILLAGLPGMAAYYTSADATPRRFHPYSNEREMLYLEPRLLDAGMAVVSAALAHELQHLVAWSSNPYQETWVDEGSAELAGSLIGYQPASFDAFEQQPDTQLTAWTDQLGGSAAHYQAAYLFLRYFLERYLTQQEMNELLSAPARGRAIFDQWLSQRGVGVTFDDVFKDWAVANYLDEMFPAGGRFGYGTLDVRARVTASLGLHSGQYMGQVRQYGTDFLELVGDGRDAELVFQGESTVSIVGAQPTSGTSFWWSHRGDNADVRLTRSIDLSGVSSAHLRFRLWHETEAAFDYGYVLVSTDGGQTWESLCTSEASHENPTGNNFGCGFSGKSGGGEEPVWLEEVIDLSPYAGQPVLIRFEYVTDQAYNARGLAIDDIAVPEIGFWDDAETEQGWRAEGFVRVDAHLTQQYSVRLLLVRGTTAEVVDVPLDGDRRGVAPIEGLGSQVSRAAVAISGLAPGTLQPAPYTVELRPR